MKIDDSFKKPGSVPFKWEIRPGVPKLPTPSTPQTGHINPQPVSENHVQKKQSPFPDTPRKLKPPPAGLYFHPPPEPRAQTRSNSLRSSPRTLSRLFGLPGMTRPDVVSSAGCFPSPMGKSKNVKKRGGYPSSLTEPGYYSDLEISSRWSVSSTKSVSPFPAYFASNQSSPRPVKDADWAGFGYQHQQI